MKNTPDYKSRFRILKGGKISLVVSALLVGGIVNIAQATDYTIGTGTVSQYFNVDEDKNITVSGDLNVTNNFTAISLYTNDTNKIDISITNAGSVILNKQYGFAGIYTYGNLLNSSITNGGTVDVNSSNMGRNDAIFALVNTDVNNTTITNNGTLHVNGNNGLANGIEVYTTGVVDINNSSITNSGTMSVASSGNNATGITLNAYNQRTNSDNSTTTTALDISNSTITNSDTMSVTGTSASGINMNAYASSHSYSADANSTATLSINNSTISNSGTMSVTGTNGNASGINLNANTYASFPAYHTANSIATLNINNSTISNSGTMSISSTNGYAYGINVNVKATAWSGNRSATLDINNSTISNSGTMSVTSTNSYAFGIDIQGNGSINNLSIENNGTISVHGGSRAYGIDSSSIYGTSLITNGVNATIQAYGTYAAKGINIGDLGDNSSVLNRGLIDVNASNSYGIDSSSIYGTSSITNDKTGVILVSGDNYNIGIYARYLEDNSSVLNSGLIDVNASSSNGNGYGILVGNSMYNNSTITNDTTGVIKVQSAGYAGYGIQAYSLYDNATVKNSGLIDVHVSNGSGYGIYSDNMYNSSSITNDVNGTITVAANYAEGIRVYSLGEDSHIVNNGTIDVNASDFAVGIDVNYMRNTSFIENSGTITATLNGVADANAYSIYVSSMADTAQVTNTSTGKLYGNIHIDGAMSNAGLISLPSNANGDYSAYIRNFNQASTGTLEIGLKTEDGNVTNNYSKLHTNTAVFANGSTIAVNVQTLEANQALLIGKTLTNVVTADSNLTINGTLKVSDNSTLLDFQEFTTNLDGNATGVNGEAGAINLNIVKGQSILGSSIAGAGNSNTQGAAAALDAIQGSGNTNMNSVFSALNALHTDAAVAAAVRSTTPLTATSSAGAGNQMMRGMQGILKMRQDSNLGLSAGDEMFGEKNLWIKPYTSFGSQDNKDGINGFALRASGFGMGVDTEYDTNKKIGVAVFYTKAAVDVNDVTQTSNLNVFSTLVYGNFPLIDDKTNILYQAGYAWQKTASSRTNFDSSVATADYTSTTASFDLRLMRDVNAGNGFGLQPMIEATYRYSNNPTYTETGAGTLNLHSDSFSSREFVTSIGSLAQYKVNNELKILGNIDVGYDSLNDNPTVTSAYEGALGTTFNTNSIDNGRWSYEAGIGVEKKNILGGDINFMYDYQAKGSAFRNNSLSAKYTIKF